MSHLLDPVTYVGRLAVRWWRTGVVTAAAAIGILAQGSGVATTFERAVGDVSAQLRQRPASGNLHIIEIDARSIAAIDRWPWPRGEHARVIDRLRAAGAATIAFDVDFSSRSSRTGDAALAAAIARAQGKVVLPTFRQAAGGGKSGYTDSLPAAPLREHAALAAVSIAPDADGLVRAAPLGTVTSATPRPSLSAMLAGRSGEVDASFLIDFAVDPATIPRHSFVDIRDGRFDPRDIAGKQMLIGATAIEIGDRYAVPRYSVIPGVVIQALAAETLMSAVPVSGGWLVPLLLALGLASILTHMRPGLRLAAASVIAPLLILVPSILVQQVFGAVMQIAPALLALLAAVALTSSARIAETFRHRRAHDEATGLPNRFALVEALARATGAAVVATQIGDFGKLAAALGPAGAAQLIHRICDRLRLVAEGIAIHRIEDGVLAWRASGGLELVAERYDTLRTLMLQPIEVCGRRVDVSLALGFAEQRGGDAARAVANAVVAANTAHADGTGWHVHVVDEEEAMERELTLLAELNDAAAAGQLIPYYQPKLCLETGRIVSVEALVRWQHPTRGFMRPDLFIPLAERNDRIAELTLAVLERTIHDVQAWAAAGHSISAAVNVSAKLLSSRPFLARVRALIDHTGIAPAMLTFEVTESAAMQDPEGAIAALQMFRDLGVRVSMDDYGTGQSTLTYLKQLPLDEVKIDRSFVQFAHQNRGDAVLVRSTIELAHELGLEVVAEGVEDQACLEYLRSVRCDLAQGFLISRPVDAAAIHAMLAEPLAIAA